MYDPDFYSTHSEEEIANAKILLAEDSSFYRNLLSSYLVAAGYEVITAEDGLQAWEKLKMEPVDLLITDIEMPNMTGFELTQKIREDTQLKDLPVIAVTSLSGEDDRRRGMEVGINDYQPKLDRDLVLEAVNNILISEKLKKAA